MRMRNVCGRLIGLAMMALVGQPELKGVLGEGRWVYQTAQAEKLATQTLEIVTAQGTHEFRVEVAETERQKAVGLMFRRSLSPMTGMLFPYPEADDLSMWMRNTYIPLDMLFIRADGVIHRVEANAEPHSETVIRAGAPVTAVLEIPGGEASRLGIQAGDKVTHGHFRSAGG
ncbi:MAG: DUF192 domain-containing protein [Pseudomonadota bacterium]